MAPKEGLGLRTQVLLLGAVVVLGCGSNITRQIAAKPLSRFTYMLGLAIGIVYVVVYWSILAALLAARVVPRDQMRWAWRGDARGLRTEPFGLPAVWIFIVSATGDALGNVLSYISTPYVTGPVHTILAQFTLFFVAVFSFFILWRRYSLAQCVGLVAVILSAAIGILPSFMRGNHEGSSKMFCVLLGLSTGGTGFAFVMKELAFGRYADWARDTSSGGAGAEEAAEEKEGDGGARESLNIFMVNSHESLFQLPLSLAMIPLAVATGQTHGQPIGTFFQEGISCAMTMEEGHACRYAGISVAFYCVINILWNLSILTSVKYNGALVTFVAIKGVVPTSGLLFAFVDWPLLGRTPMHWLTWLSFCLIMPAIAFYVWATRLQEEREARHPELAACCWPLGKRRAKAFASD